MSNRITEKLLQSTVDVINRMTGQPEKPYSDGKANPGNYHLDMVNGAYGLSQMSNEGGGTRMIIYPDTKRNLYRAMQAFIAGLEAKKK